jgi:hypothetical protein
MIILDKVYISPRMRAYMAQTQHPVVDTPTARAVAAEGCNLNLIAEDEAVRRIDAGERLYTNAEATLSWVTSHVHNPNLLRALSIFKDKARTREILAPLFPDYAFTTCTIEELMAMPYPEERVPFVLKPSVGFLSIGVYVIESENDWIHARADIEAHRSLWATQYDASVVGSTRFILEPMLTGVEYAIDAYYDADGKAHILDILQHDFANESDTSDRLYYTGPRIIREQGARMLDFLTKANDLIKVHDIPVHLEVRVNNGRVYPIEFNPLRFAGLGSTEISSYAYGFYTYDYYLNDKDPDWKSLLADDSDDLYCMSAIAPSTAVPTDSSFDYDAFAQQLDHVLSLDHFNYAASGLFAFMFWRTSATNDKERTWLLNDDLMSFVCHES